MLLYAEAQPPNELVKKLLVEQEIEVIRYRTRDGNAPDVKQLRRAVELRLVLVKFLNTRGGTELGANLCNDDGSFDASRAVWDESANTLVVRGRLKLDYTPVQLTATIDLTTFKGTVSCVARLVNAHANARARIQGKLTVVPDFEIKRD